MPRLARRRRRNTESQRELEGWAEAFTWGTDFFHGLWSIGVTIEATKTWRDPQYPAMQHSNYNEVFRDKVREAWGRLGAEFMRQWPAIGTDYNRETPWAMTEFGQP